MIGIKAIKPRIFDVSYICDECFIICELETQLNNLRPDSDHIEIEQELRMFRPFSCEDCGSDEISVLSYEERL